MAMLGEQMPSAPARQTAKANFRMRKTFLPVRFVDAPRAL
jgi:hypothetical protein